MTARLLPIFTILFFAATAPAQSTRLGDLDADGRATVLDLVRLLGHLNGANRLPPELLPFGDIDEDGAIDTSDVTLLQNAILGSYLLPNPYAAPVLNTPVSATNGSSLVIRGVARPHRQILVTGGSVAVFTVADSNGLFSVTVNLRPNQVNNLFVTASSSNFVSGTPQPLRVLQDSQAPNLYIDFPTNGQTLFTSNTVVAGRVGDMLSGFMGLDVIVSNYVVGTTSTSSPTFSAAANVNVGIGNNGTYERGNVPLAPGTNLLTVTASDAHGNAVSRVISVQYSVISSNAPRLVALSGDLQRTNVHRRLAQPITVRVLQGSGAPFANKLVTLEVTRSDGRLFPVKLSAVADVRRLTNDITLTPHGIMSLQLFTDANGEAAAWWALGGDAGCGNNRVCVTSAGISNSVFFCASAQAAAVHQINIGMGNNQKTEAGGFLAEPLRAWVSDSCNGIPGLPITFTVVQGGGRLLRVGDEASLTNQSLLTSAPTSLTITSSITGHAEVLLQVGPDAGRNIVEATYSGNPMLPATFIAYGVTRHSSQPTGLSGVVLDNANCPIGGAACSVSVGGQMFTTTTDVQGQFHFNASTLLAGPAQLFVDGATATNLLGALIPTNSFPSLEFSLILIPNAENSLPNPVLLPRLNLNNQRLYYGTNDLVLTCEGMAGLRMTIKANSMSHPDGTPVTVARPARVSLNQVHHDNVPMPMPDGASPPFAWTLQPGGATFDPPITIEYPNMTALPAGGIAYFLSFNHDTKRFEIIASGHVVGDGSKIMTDLGAGLTVAGWGCNCPPYAATCDVESCPDSAAPPAGRSPPPGRCCPIQLTGPTVVSTNGAIMITATGGEVTWEVDQPGGQVAFVTAPTTITLHGRMASQNRDDIVVRATATKGRNCVKEYRVTAVAAFFKASAPCCAFDDTLTPPWLMAPKGDDNTAQLEIQPPDAIGLVELESSDLSLATVSPAMPGATPETVTVTGVAKGTPEIRAKLMETGAIIAVLKISVKEQLSKLVVIHAITEQNRNLVPARAPSALDLENYLNDSIWGKQANVYFIVIRTDFTIPYDLNTNGICEVGNPAANQLSDEEVAIIQGAADTNAAINVYYVQRYGVAGLMVNAATAAVGSAIGAQTFIQDGHVNTTLNITAHEVGHGLGLSPYESGDIKDVMYGVSDVSDPCRVIKHDWDIVNP